MITKNTIGQRIKYIRDREQIQQKQLASDLNIPQSTLAKYETGINLPSILTLAAIAKYLNTSIEEFLLTDD